MAVGVNFECNFKPKLPMRKKKETMVVLHVTNGCKSCTNEPVYSTL